MTTAASKAKQARVVELVIAGASVTEAAKEVGVSVRHAFRLIADPEARADITRAAQESAKAARLVLQRGGEEAARSLVQMSTGKVKATPARVAACRGVLDFVIERAAQNLNVVASRATTLPESFTAGAVGVLQRALEEAEGAQPDDKSGGTAGESTESRNDSNGLVDVTEAGPAEGAQRGPGGEE